ncbi:hypothetical protein V6N12_067068 [Hibiscus sabdariffa]|uniref:Cytochrome b5 heme-binding domain-containing protein n=1 Tax=Hibiscus sabdariffa TaxID=183260 RepID=A0ABR2ALC8_9ROSI
MGGDGKVFTFAQVSEHNHRKDCWLIINGKVYDVTKFLEDHPGGDEVLLSATGKDATDDFEDVGHSDSAIDMMDQYCVGGLMSQPSRRLPNMNPLHSLVIIRTRHLSSLSSSFSSWFLSPSSVWPSVSASTPNHLKIPNCVGIMENLSSH